MSWQYTPYVPPLLIAAAMSVALALYALRRRHVPGAVPFAVLMLGAAEWSVGYTIELGNAGLSARVFWSNVNFVGIVTIPTAWLVFALQYAGYEKWLTRRNLVLLAIEPFVTLLLAWTNESNGLFRSDVRLDTSGSVSMLAVTYSTGFWVNVVYSYLLIFLATLLLLRVFIRSPHLYRGQIGASLISLLPPLVGNALHIYGWSPFPHLDLTPFSFTLSGVAIAWGFFRFRLFDLVPVARDAVIEGMEDGVMVLDTQNRIVDANRLAAQIIGRPVSEIVGQPAAQVLSAWPDLIERYSGVTETRTEIALDVDEAQRQYDLRISPLYDRRGRLAGRLFVSRDITDRKQAEALLREERETFFSILQKAPYGVLLIDQDERCLYVNPEFTKITGYPLDDIPTVADWFRQAFPDPVYRQEVMERWQEDTIRRTSQSFSLVCKGGEIKEIEVRPTLLGDGRALMALTDVTERMRAEEALRRAHEQLRATLDALPDLLFEVDRDGRIYDFRAPRPGLLYLPSQEFLGRTVNEIIPEEAASVIMDAIGQAIETGRHAGAVYPLETPAGLGWFELSVAAKGDPGAPGACFIALIRDITERKQAETGLRESEERYRTLVEQSLEGLVVLGSDGIVFANAVAADLVDHTVEELMSFSADDVKAIIHPDDRALVWERFLDRLAGKPVPLRYEFRLIRKDGTVCWVEMSSNRTEYRGGPAVQATLMDITDRKQAEEEIHRRAAHQEALGAIIATAAAAADLSELLETALDHTLGALGLGMGSVWVPPYAAMRGLPQEMYDGIAQVASEFGLDFPGPSVVEDWQGVAADSPLSSIRPIMTRFGIRASLIVPFLAEGQRIGGLGLAAPEPHPWSSEEISLVEAVGRQLGGAAERLRLLGKIQEQARQMQQMMDSVPEGVLLLDADERIVVANPVARENLAVLTNAQVGDTLTHLGDRRLAELLTSPRKGLWHEVAAERRSFQVIARPVGKATETDPTPGGWVLVVRDVTQQREVEQRIQQQERLVAVGQLAAGIAHDFNNIMATIVLYAQMAARSEGISTRDRERMEMIDEQAKHATRLVQQILDFSRRAVLERRPLDLLLLLKEQARLLKRTLPESIEIELDYGHNDYTVNADPTRMQQMMTNLAVNARDAMPEGGRLRFGLERMRIEQSEAPPLPEMTAGEWVRMTVSDTGSGIRSDDLPHIFEPFFTTKEPGRGSGLGLAQVHGIVGAHEGHIDVASQVGQGATFTIYLPALPLHPPEVLTDVSLQALPALTKGEGEIILVVEDSASARRAVVESLELLGYQVLEVANGQEALTVLEEHGEEIALVLSDVVMPGMGGVALLHALRERGSTVPVVMLTGHAMQREMEDLQEQGMLEWLSKPPRLEELAEVIARALGTDR
jgi:two-component system cell cycle sensor histidine kinase/response regulator CckA